MNDIIRKVQGLLRKAEGTDNQHEADTFSQHAEKLIAKYQIDRAALAKTFIDENGMRHRVEPVGRCVGRHAKLMVLQTISNLNGVYTLDAPATKRSVIPDGAAILTGDDESIDLCLLLWKSLMIQLDNATAAYLKSLPKGSRRGKRLSFMYGWCKIVSDRLEETYHNAHRLAGSGTDLVLYSSLQRAKDAATDEYNPTQSKEKKVWLDPASYSLGILAGMQANIGGSELQNNTHKEIG